MLWGMLQGAGAVRWALLEAGGSSSVLGMRLENLKQQTLEQQQAAFLWDI